MAEHFARRKLDAALPELCRLLRECNFLTTSCAKLRLNRFHVYERIAAGKKEGANKSDAHFALEVEAARAEAVCSLVEAVRLHQTPARGESGTDWKAAAWLLEHLDPVNWGQRVQVHVREQVEHVYDIAQRVLPTEYYASLLTALAASGGETGSTSESSSGDSN